MLAGSSVVMKEVPDGLTVLEPFVFSETSIVILP